MADPAAASARAMAEITNHPLMWTDRSRHAKPGLRYATPRGGWSYSRPGPVTLPDNLRPRQPRTIEVRVVVKLDEVERLRADLRIANEATLELLTSCADAEREVERLGAELGKTRPVEPGISVNDLIRVLRQRYRADL